MVYASGHVAYTYMVLKVVYIQMYFSFQQAGTNKLKRGELL